MSDDAGSLAASPRVEARLATAGTVLLAQGALFGLYSLGLFLWILPEIGEENRSAIGQGLMMIGGLLSVLMGAIAVWLLRLGRHARHLLLRPVSTYIAQGVLLCAWILSGPMPLMPAVMLASVFGLNDFDALYYVLSSATVALVGSVVFVVWTMAAVNAAVPRE